MENDYQILSNTFNHDMDWFSVEGWMNPKKYLPDVFIDAKKQRKVKKLMFLVKKQYYGRTEPHVYVDIGFWYPDRFMSIEFEDWDDYDPKMYPYTEDDPDNGEVWLKEGFYHLPESLKYERKWHYL